MPVSSFPGPLAREPSPSEAKNGVRTSCAQSPGATAFTSPKLKNGPPAGAFRYLIRHQIVPPSARTPNFSDAELTASENRITPPPSVTESARLKP